MKKIATIILLFVSGTLAAQDIALPKPQTTGGKPLMETLNARRTGRSFSAQELTQKQLSNLLWAANGVNRTDGKRTAPSAGDSREIDIYVFLKTGVYFYDAAANKLIQKSTADNRKNVGRQPFVEVAPVILVFVANFDKLSRFDEASRTFYSATDVGYVSQNVYLYAASEGLATVALGMIKKEELTSLLNLKNGTPLLGQPVGYPGK
ncbi:MAG: SagB/ThcOx family dehydrogenase [Prevotellaceae bacterium]|jgi:SagB-type dehydrogenase family enzyme|nr:SagB/ThcOx family dehydrogenase [Prevotellaceae bacterium]